MSHDYEDFGVAPLSVDKIEARADELRKWLELGPTSAVPRISEAFGRLGFTIHSRSLDEMGRAKAYFDKLNGEIHFREDVRDQLQDDVPAARWVALHELGHVLLKHELQQRAFLVDGGNTRLGFLSDDASAETQADRFADAILMPRTMIASVHSARQLVELANAPLERAFVRYNLVKTFEVRATPDGIKEAISRLHASVKALDNSKHDANVDIEKLKRSLWLALPVLKGNWRSLDGRWAICWDYFERTRSGGWRIVDGGIVAWEDERSR